MDISKTIDITAFPNVFYKKTREEIEGYLKIFRRDLTRKLWTRGVVLLYDFYYSYGILLTKECLIYGWDLLNSANDDHPPEENALCTWKILDSGSIVVTFHNVKDLSKSFQHDEDFQKEMDNGLYDTWL